MYHCYILQVGHSVVARKLCGGFRGEHDGSLLALNCQLPILEAVMMCVERGWMTILVRRWPT